MVIRKVLIFDCGSGPFGQRRLTCKGNTGIDKVCARSESLSGISVFLCMRKLWSKLDKSTLHLNKHELNVSLVELYEQMLCRNDHKNDLERQNEQI